MWFKMAKIYICYYNLRVYNQNLVVKLFSNKKLKNNFDNSKIYC